MNYFFNNLEKLKTRAVQITAILYTFSLTNIVKSQTNYFNTDSIIYKRTILGEDRNNPFTISVLNQAYSLVYNGQTGNYGITHLYVKFKPTADSQYIDLMKSRLDLFDFPLTRQIIEYNDYYYEWQDSGTYPQLYSVIEPGQSLPMVNYEVIDYLNLTIEDTLVMKMAAQLTGNLNDLPSIVPKKDIEIEEGGGGGSGNGGGTGQNSACGCPKRHNREPSGCVMVWDTEYSSFVPVKSLTVKVKDNWFKVKTTLTNINGCWNIPVKHYGKVWVHFNFENDHVRIRSVHKSNRQIAMAWASTVKHHLQVIQGPIYNNIVTQYAMWNDNGSIAHVLWSSATTVNSEQEMRIFATQDYIQYPTRQLEIFIGHTESGNFGFAFMKNFLGKQLSKATIGASIGFSASAPVFWTKYMNIALPAKLSISALIADNVVPLIPDIMITDNFDLSDEFKQLTFHEMGHALHALRVGKLWWSELINLEIVHNEENGLPYGDGNFNDADMVALTESWAEFIGTTYTHLIYSNV